MIYDAVTGGAITHAKAFERWCQAMMIAPSGPRVVAGNEAGKLMVFDMIAGKVVKSVEVDKHAITGLALSPDESVLAATDGGGHVHLLKWPSLETAGKIDISDDTAWCVAFVYEGSKLLVGSADRNLYLVDPVDSAKPKSIAKGSDWITRIAVSPSGQVAASEVGGRLHFPSMGGTDSMDADSGVWSLCWNEKSQLFAGTRKDGIVIAARAWTFTEPTPEPEEPEEEEVTQEAAAAEASDAGGSDANAEDTEADQAAAKESPEADKEEPQQEEAKQEEPQQEETKQEETKQEEAKQE